MMPDYLYFPLLLNINTENVVLQNVYFNNIIILLYSVSKVAARSTKGQTHEMSHVTTLLYPHCVLKVQSL